MGGTIIKYFAILVLSANAFHANSQPAHSINADATYPNLFSFPLDPVQGGKEQTDNPATLYVYLFLSPECPLCQHYMPALTNLQRVYKDQVIIRGIVPGRAYTKDTLLQFINDYGINFPLYIDSSKLLTSYVSATVTPEVMMFTKDAKRIYSGAIDDWLKDLGQQRIKPTRLYLEDAISSLLNHKKIKVAKTEAKGCLINDL